MLTAYDFPFAEIIDESGIDAILVGDSLGMVALGQENTLYVTMDEMLHHCRAVARGVENALLVGDMPFLSYQVSKSEAVRNAGLFLKEGRMDAVKLEGGRERMETIQAIVGAGIPVMGHLGLTPQSINRLGGFVAQGKTAADAKSILEDAILLETAGCFSIVLESIPSRLAAYISEQISIPTIGIGAGNGCDGQVLVTQDMLGLFEKIKPRFVKTYANLRPMILEALLEYKQDVEKEIFPTMDHSFTIKDDEWNKFVDLLKNS
ncbi:MAG: 3-methyl-2-oxobutanoate hydroxymethyltransferase [Anaerolineaceae bacterium]|nr:3-methyl-2-oxobutanoate hydroxymethyltransferase [Anaerolineaceae bacterium]